MKCDELKDYDIMDIEAMDDERLEKSESGKIQVTRVYIKSEVDAVIAELKAKNENIKDALGGTTIAYKQVCDEYEQCDKGLRATLRALWLARAERAKWESLYYWYAISNKFKSRKFDEVERKCRAKAEEYK